MIDFSAPTGGVTQWFTRLGEVPGVLWKSLAEPEPRFRGARPVSREDRSPGGPQLRWLDSQGRPLADEWTYRDSPVHLLLQDFYIAVPARQLEMALQALEVPGTPEDYGVALLFARRAAQSQDPPDFSLLEQLLVAHIALVLADPQAAIGEGRPLEQARWPFTELVNLYRREGFLLEAAEIQMLLTRIAQEARPGHLTEAGPQQLLDALREMT